MLLAIFLSGVQGVGAQVYHVEINVDMAARTTVAGINATYLVNISNVGVVSLI